MIETQELLEGIKIMAIDMLLKKDVDFESYPHDNIESLIKKRILLIGFCFDGNTFRIVYFIKIPHSMNDYMTLGTKESHQITIRDTQEPVFMISEETEMQLFGELLN